MWFGGLFGGEEGADGFAFDDPSDVALDFEIEDEDGDFLFLAHAEGGHVHDAQVFADGFLEGKGFVAGGAGVFVGVRGVDAVHFGGFEKDVAVEFGGAEGGAGVGGEEGVACSCGEDDNAAFFEMADGAASDEGFGDGADVEGGHDPGGNPEGDKFFFEGEGVDDGSEHAHVVGGGLLDVAGFGEFGAPDDVSASDDDGDLGSGACCVFDFFGDGGEFLCGDPEGARGAEGFAGEFEEDAVGFGAVGLRVVGHSVLHVLGIEHRGEGRVNLRG